MIEKNSEYIAYRQFMLVKDIILRKEAGLVSSFSISVDLTFKIAEKVKTRLPTGKLFSMSDSLLTVFSEGKCILQQLGVGNSLMQFKEVFLWIKEILGTPHMIISDTCCDDTLMFVQVFGEQIRGKIKLDIAHFTHRLFKTLPGKTAKNSTLLRKIKSTYKNTPFATRDMGPFHETVSLSPKDIVSNLSDFRAFVMEIQSDTGIQFWDTK